MCACLQFQKPTGSTDGARNSRVLAAILNLIIILYTKLRITRTKNKYSGIPEMAQNTSNNSGFNVE